MRPIRFTYAIGDVQGCYDPLMRLLEKLNFCETQDCLWFTGDIINRGPQSLETLRFIKNLPHCVTVLGNHDIHLITAFDGVYRPHPKDTLEDILQAPDAEVLIDFLRTRPLLYEDKKYNVGLVHAGIHPLWDWEAAKQYAQEAEGFIQNKILWLDNLNYFYGNHPDQWSDNLRA